MSALSTPWIGDAVSANQLFQYHSRESLHLGVRIPAQPAIIARVREHLNRGAILLELLWLSWVGLAPELAHAAHEGRVFRVEGRAMCA